ncbi:L,D-transpeptidase family protein [Isoptericola variabilis]|uniref:ErfK/YbiS/YcfS/YnhG family protein n=1 Tax=Isoptericola variabilis (strain 225) TaxID=743718 RepID=F6FVT7_ISOV2|nr:L,D-transpeptidase family protein [Isoptericola variabilis]AEG43417.1 ErfK/YbiS/YcfS/YnhG family protein [Isoptericola variabilis 225]TWH34526.1 putative peptidoglycan-binding domain-containing protein [Isoptericola variabilis J7]
MTTERTTARRRRPAAAAATALALFLLPGCAMLDDGAEPEPGSAPAAEAPTTAAPSATPSGETSAEPDASSAPSAAPSTTPSSTPSAEADAPDPGAGPSASPSAEGDDAPGEGAGNGQTNGNGNANGNANGNGKGNGKDAQEEKPEHLERGATGERVAALQQRLQDLGYFLPEVDGSFGPATQQAVWALQKAAGLHRDGVVGPKTQAALDQGVRPSPVSSSGKVVEIDLDRQLLLAVEDGRVVRTINASSGNGETFEALGRTYRATTPRGTFAVYMERDYLHESTLELGAMYRPKYFTGGIAVHGSPSIPPYPASHGCVRVSNSAMNWLWDSWGMPKGTTVVVH